MELPLTPKNNQQNNKGHIVSITLPSSNPYDMNILNPSNISHIENEKKYKNDSVLKHNSNATNDMSSTKSSNLSNAEIKKKHPNDIKKSNIQNDTSSYKSLFTSLDSSSDISSESFSNQKENTKKSNNTTTFKNTIVIVDNNILSDIESDESSKNIENKSTDVIDNLINNSSKNCTDGSSKISLMKDNNSKNNLKNDIKDCSSASVMSPTYDSDSEYSSDQTKNNFNSRQDNNNTNKNNKNPSKQNVTHTLKTIQSSTNSTLKSSTNSTSKFYKQNPITTSVIRNNKTIPSKFINKKAKELFDDDFIDSFHVVRKVDKNGSTIPKAPSDLRLKGKNIIKFKLNNSETKMMDILKIETKEVDPIGNCFFDTILKWEDDKNEIPYNSHFDSILKSRKYVAYTFMKVMCDHHVYEYTNDNAKQRRNLILASVLSEPYTNWYNEEDQNKFFHIPQGEQFIDRSLWLELIPLPFLSFEFKKSILIFLPNMGKNDNWLKTGSYAFIRYDDRYPNLLPFFEKNMTGENQGYVTFDKTKTLFLKYYLNEHFEPYIKATNVETRNTTFSDIDQKQTEQKSKEIDESSPLYVTDEKYQKMKETYKTLLSSKALVKEPVYYPSRNTDVLKGQFNKQNNSKE